MEPARGLGEVGSDSLSASVLSPQDSQGPVPHSFQRPIVPLPGVTPAQLLASKTRKWNKRPSYKNGKGGHVCVKCAHRGMSNGEGRSPLIHTRGDH